MPAEALKEKEAVLVWCYSTFRDLLHLDIPKKRRCLSVCPGPEIRRLFTCCHTNATVSITQTVVLHGNFSSTITILLEMSLFPYSRLFCTLV